MSTPDTPTPSMAPHEILTSLGACPDAVKWSKKYRSAKSAWANCERGDWLLWLAGKKAGPVGDEKRKKLVLAACGCARIALPIWQKRYPDDKRVEVCLDTAERWARNEATLEALQVARINCSSAAYAAYADAHAASAAAYAAASAAYADADADAAYAASYAAASAAYAAAYAASAADAAYAAYAAYADAAKKETLKKCSDIVRQTWPTIPEWAK